MKYLQVREEIEIRETGLTPGVENEPDEIRKGWTRPKSVRDEFI